ncbi:hypothetical protein ACWD0A_27375 [Streptomyces sp. NPDC002867]
MRSNGTSLSSAVIGMVPAHTPVRTGAVEVPSMLRFRPAFLIAVGAVPAGLVCAAFLLSHKEAGRPRLPAAGPQDPAADLPAGFHGHVRDAEGAPVACAM